jgi:hypothetical protein
MSVILGIDPHKATDTAVAIDRDEQPITTVQVVADRCQTQRLLAWAASFGLERTWAIESANGLGKLLARQLLGAGEPAVDVPPTLSAPGLVAGLDQDGKNDSNDALSSVHEQRLRRHPAGGRGRLHPPVVTLPGRSCRARSCTWGGAVHPDARRTAARRPLPRRPCRQDCSDRAGAVPVRQQDRLGPAQQGRRGHRRRQPGRRGGPVADGRGHSRPAGAPSMIATVVTILGFLVQRSTGAPPPVRRRIQSPEFMSLA